MSFTEGLNIVRAENSWGKSTTINSLLYALGFEIILGRKGPESLKPALRKKLEYEDREYTVLESYIELEITNNKEDVITIKRQIIGEQDHRLMTVWKTARLTTDSHNTNVPSDFYFVHTAGAAKNEKGFHAFLADFLGLELPVVSTYEDREVPLYIECFLPLMFIEQQRGWSGIQATTPTRYGIRNVAKIAIEYVLALDVAELQKKKRELQDEKRQLRSDWSNEGKRLRYLANLMSGVVNNFPPSPSTSFEESDEPKILVARADKSWQSSGEYLIRLRADVEEYKLKLRGQAGNAKEKAGSLTQELELAENAILQIEAALTAARADRDAEQANLDMLYQRIDAITKDIVNNQDALKLKQYGAQIETSVSSGECPTCGQAISDVLFSQADSIGTPMTIEENIDFLKQQRQAARLLQNSSAEALEKKIQQVNILQDHAINTRQKIRDLKASLLQDVEYPNRAQIRELVKLEERVEQVEKALEEVEEIINGIRGLSAKWQELLAEESRLPKEYFSEEDKAKLGKITELFRRNITLFDFKSASPSEIEISRDTYRPSLDGFEMVFDASASDNIRIIWAYTLALQELNHFFKTNHLGLTIFDEPRQQQVSNESREKFYKKIGRLKREENQVIITTSEKRDMLAAILQNVEHNFIDFQNKVIAPLN